MHRGVNVFISMIEEGPNRGSFLFAKITACIIENDEGGQKYDTIHNSTYYDPYISGGGDCCHKHWRQCIPRDIW